MKDVTVKDRNKLVLVGAGHSNLHLVKNAMLLQSHGFDITLISPTDLYYNGVAPGVLSNQYPTGFGRITAKCHLDKVKGKNYQKKVTRIDLKNKQVQLEDHKFIRFDYLSINTGGSVPTNQIPGSSTFSIPIRPIGSFWQLSEEIQRLRNNSPESISVTIIGGGAAGVEVAGNVHHLIKSFGIIPVISIITKGELILSQFSSSVSNKVSKLFRQRGINIITKSKVVEIREEEIVLKRNKEHPYEFCVLATGIIPNSIDSQGLLQTTENGELVVNSFLQCTDNPQVFATGDCSHFEAQPLWKSGYHAINQGPVLLKNIVAQSEGSQLYEYKPSKRILTALNLGSKAGLVIFGKYSHLGKLGFIIKDYIEKRYINSYRCKSKA